MRLHAFSAVSAALLLAGCGGPTDHGPVEAGEQAVKAPLALVEALSGTWMPEDYCACLERHRSAYTCGSLLKDVYVMNVSPKGPDSLEWGYITMHEGGPEVMLGYDPHVQGFVGQSGEYSTEEVIHSEVRGQGPFRAKHCPTRSAASIRSCGKRTGTPARCPVLRGVRG